MIDDNVTSSIYGTSIALKVGFLGLLAVVFLLSFLFEGAVLYLIAMIRSMQMVLHFPIMNIVMPSNIMTTFQILIPIVMFDILE